MFAIEKKTMDSCNRLEKMQKTISNTKFNFDTR